MLEKVKIRKISLQIWNVVYVNRITILFRTNMDSAKKIYSHKHPSFVDSRYLLESNRMI